MRKIILLFCFLLSGITLFAQDYPLVTIQYIQSLPDSVGEGPSPHDGDTVRVQGSVLVRPVIDADTARRVIISAGASWATYIQDPAGQLWGGMYVLQLNDTVGNAQNTFFDLVDTAQVVEFTGVISEYYTTTEFLLITQPEPIPVSIISQEPKRPDPIELQLSDLYSEDGNYSGIEKYESMYVIFRNVITSDRASNGNFTINDGQGHSAIIYNQSRYFKTGSAGEIPGYQPPLDGTYLSYVRGMGYTWSDGSFHIVPMYPNDVGPSITSPPSISSIKRDIVEVRPNQPVTVSAKITDFDGTIENARLYYSIDDAARDSITMTYSTSDSLYKATIPGVNSDSSVVDYYIWAVDDDTLESVNPFTTADDYFYLVLNRPLTIKDVQFSPLGGGYSAYNGYEVTVRGIVTADTSDIDGNETGTASSPAVYIQDGTGPWSGIRIFGTEALDRNRGDDVTVTGMVYENFGVTQIGTTGSGAMVTINDTGKTLPEAQLISTVDIDDLPDGSIEAEKWEGVLVKVANVVVTDENADGDPGPDEGSGGSRNYGDILVADTSNSSLRIDLEDGGDHQYHNYWLPYLENQPTRIYEGSSFKSITGICWYAFSHYKLIPRINEDFEGFVVGVKDEKSIQPTAYTLKQNYPNPFNPSTTIQYSISVAGNVSINIYNILGQEVKTVLDQVSQTAGTYKIVFDAKDLPTGIYLYRIIVNNYVATKKMVLLK